MKIIKLIKGLYKYIVFLLIFTVIQVGGELYLPKIMASIVDIGIVNSDMNFIKNKIFIMIFFAIISLLATIVVNYSSSKFATSFSYRIRKSLYSKINELSKTEIEGFGVSTLITRSTSDVTNVTNFFGMALRLFLMAPIMGIVASFLAYQTEPRFFPIILFSVIILIVLIVSLFLIVIPKFERVQELLDKINNSAREILYGLRVIKAFNKQDYFKKRFDKVNTENKKLNIFIQKIIFLVEPVMILGINFASLLIIYVACNYINMGTLEVGSVLAFIQYEGVILMSFLMILMMLIILPKTIVSLRRINDILNKESSVKNNGNLILKNIQTIEFKNVYFKYPNSKKYTLNNVSFVINKGENVGIIGSSGCGKSTLNNLLLRQFNITKGIILINNIDIKKYEISSLRSRFNYVPQKAMLFKGSIKENLVFDSNITESEIIKATKTSYIDSFINEKNEKLLYNIDQSAVNLSGGQKQRLTIARALLNGGDVILFDDSFSAVDYITDKSIRTSLEKYYKDKISIMITQRVGTIKNCDKIIVLEKGSIDSIGTYEELNKTSKVFKEFVISQINEVDKDEKTK